MSPTHAFKDRRALVVLMKQLTLVDKRWMLGIETKLILAYELRFSEDTVRRHVRLRRLFKKLQTFTAALAAKLS